ncbi:replicative DNA helicase [Streptomyces longwoodensis]|uniref:replicative DNA helicase n=1 Tax=Streptomyces longwoodensis TaxID=68231 RepID=UPI003F5738CF
MNEPQDDVQRALPHDRTAEQSVLGAMLLSPAAIADAVDNLHSAADFYHANHQAIYAAIIEMYGRGEPVDPITLSAELAKTGDLDRVGGAPYLHHLIQQVPTAAHAEHYAGIVSGFAEFSRIAAAGTQITQLGYRAQGDISEVKDQAARILERALLTREDSQGAQIGHHLEQYLDVLEARRNGGDVPGVPTGFTDFDALAGGLHPGQMVIVAARPAMGKSTLALDITRSCSIRHGRPAAFFSLEMSREELLDRALSAEARVALHHLRSGQLTDEDWTRIARRIPDISAAPLFIDDTPGQTLAGIKAKCRRRQQRDGLDLVVIDYLQLLSSGTSRRHENRQQEVSELSRGIKLLAKELEVPVVVVAQLNRGPEQRNDKKPMLADLRESGSLEQDADLVILVHREDAYDRQSPRAGEADLMVVKHRNGPTATITVAGQLHFARFVDMAKTVDSTAVRIPRDLRVVTDHFRSQQAELETP